MKALLLASLLLGAGDYVIPGRLELPSYTRYIDVTASMLFNGAVPPTEEVFGDTRGKCWDADTELAHGVIVVPADWDGASDMTLKVYWATKNGVAMADTETVIWRVIYRSRAVGETFGSGTAVEINPTYTQSGAGTHELITATSVAVDYDNANQPLTAGDLFSYQVLRNFTGDGYGDDACIVSLELAYTSTYVPRR